MRTVKEVKEKLEQNEKNLSENQIGYNRYEIKKERYKCELRQAEIYEKLEAIHRGIDIINDKISKKA